MLPSGWITRRFGEIASFKNGLNFTHSNEGESIKIVGVADFQKRTELSSTVELATIRVPTKVRDSELLESGDLLFVRSNGNRALIGRCLFFPNVAERLAFSGFTIRGRVDRNVIAPVFASYLVRSKMVTDQIFQGGSGTNISNLSQEILADIRLRIPPISEQEQITRVLMSWDDAIAVSESLFANSRKQKRALMQQLLDAQRQREGRTKGWRTYQLRELFTERTETGRTDLPLLSITRDDGVINREDVGRKDTSNEDKSKYRRICPGDIGYNTMRMWQGVSALSDLEGIVSPAYTIVTPTPMIDGRFASYLFKLDRVVFEFYRYSQGLVSDTWNLKYPHFAKVKVTIPSRSEQEKIVAILSAADATIQAMAKEIEKLQVEKCALMQLLLTGKRRVRQSKSKTRTAA